MDPDMCGPFNENDAHTANLLFEQTHYGPVTVRSEVRDVECTWGLDRLVSCFEIDPARHWDIATNEVRRSLAPANSETWERLTTGSIPYCPARNNSGCNRGALSILAAPFQPIGLS